MKNVYCDICYKHFNTYVIKERMSLIEIILQVIIKHIHCAVTLICTVCNVVALNYKKKNKHKMWEWTSTKKSYKITIVKLQFKVDLLLLIFAKINIPLIKIIRYVKGLHAIKYLQSRVLMDSWYSIRSRVESPIKDSRVEETIQKNLCSKDKISYSPNYTFNVI